ncbi:MAG: M23 family metallopeptidase [Maricaulaceae bacterium]|nr:M23 family metallopeptidase [Maricaulaceae bacterium]
MTGFDVNNADSNRSRGLAIAASLALSAVLLAALFVVRPGDGAAAESLRAAPPLQVALDAVESVETAPEPDAAGAVFGPASFIAACDDCPLLTTERMTVPRGGTMAGVLTAAGAANGEAAGAISALGGVFDLRRLRAGQEISIYLETPAAAAETEPQPRLAGLSFRPEVDRSITVARAHDGSWRARETQPVFHADVARAQGEIVNSLYLDALRAGATDRIVVEMAAVMAYAIDFQRSIHQGDRFDVVFERHVDSRGAVARTGDILYIRYEGRARSQPLEFFRFRTPDGIIGYYNAEGESAERLLMMTPVSGARISSNFGMRRHPISGFNRMHQGTDFAAPTGTPIYAAGHGVVERADRFGGYGNYVRIRHANGYQTAYAHLSRFAVRRGANVRQGQVIGYVGCTGSCTGPHLHYEVHHNGRPVNPMRLDLPTGRRLEANELPAFRAERDRIIALRDNAVPATDTGRELLVAQQGEREI